MMLLGKLRSVSMGAASFTHWSKVRRSLNPARGHVKLRRATGGAIETTVQWSVRRLVLSLLVTSGCNEFFELRTTGLFDAAYFDAPIDAPFACPPIGDPPPTFARNIYQDVAQHCSELTISVTGHRAAQCVEPRLGPAEAKPGEDTLTVLPAFEPTANVTYDLPRLSPEGDELFLRFYDRTVSAPHELRRYRRVDDAWSYIEPVLSLTVADSITGQPSAGPIRRMMVSRTGLLVEYEIPAAGLAALVTQYNATELGVPLESVLPNLSPDGLRLVFISRPAGDLVDHLFYTDRISLSSRFREAVQIPGVPGVPDAIMTSGCERIHFSAVQSLFYVQQH